VRRTTGTGGKKKKKKKNRNSNRNRNNNKKTTTKKKNNNTNAITVRLPTAMIVTLQQTAMAHFHVVSTHAIFFGL